MNRLSSNGKNIDVSDHREILEKCMQSILDFFPCIYSPADVFAGKILNLMEERSRAAIFAGHVFKWFPHLFVSLRLTVK